MLPVLPVTLTFAGAAALLNLWLALRVVLVRRAAKVLTGDGDHALLRCRMRAQANFAEYTPFVLILMGLLELAQQPQRWLWWIGFLYVAARIVHPIGMDINRTNPLRAAGAVLTWAILLVLGLWAIWAASAIPGHPVATGLS